MMTVILNIIALIKASTVNSATCVITAVVVIAMCKHIQVKFSGTNADKCSCRRDETSTDDMRSERQYLYSCVEVRAASVNLGNDA